MDFSQVLDQECSNIVPNIISRDRFVQECKDCFIIMDSHGDGLVSTSFLPVMLRSLGQLWTQNEIQLAKAEVEAATKNSGYMDIEIFTVFALRHFDKPVGVISVSNEYKVLDTRRQGSLSTKTLLRHLECFGERMPQEHSKYLLRQEGLELSKNLTEDQFVSKAASSSNSEMVGLKVTVLHKCKPKQAKKIKAWKNKQFALKHMYTEDGTLVREVNKQIKRRNLIREKLKESNCYFQELTPEQQELIRKYEDSIKSKKVRYYEEMEG